MPDMLAMPLSDWFWLAAGTLPNLGTMAYFAFWWEPGR